MRLLFVNHLSNAFESLRGNRLRTGLTILGVTIGVASITVILSLSGGATKIITDQVGELGGAVAVDLHIALEGAAGHFHGGRRSALELQHSAVAAVQGRIVQHLDIGADTVVHQDSRTAAAFYA